MTSSWVILGGGNGSTNLGDDSMWEAAVATIRSVDPSAVIITDAHPLPWTPDEPEVIVLPLLYAALRRGYGLRPALLERLVSYPARDRVARRAVTGRMPRRVQELCKKWDEAIAESQGVVFAGSGAITDDYAGHGIYSWSTVASLARAHGKRFAFVGQGVGPLKIGRNREAAAAMLRAADLVTVREAMSLALLEGMGIEAIRTPDWAIANIPRGEDRACASGAVASLVDGSPFVAVSFHRRHNMRLEALRKLADVFGSVVREADRLGLRALVVPSMRGGRYADDRLTARRLIRMSGLTEDRVRILDGPVSARVTRAVLGMSEAVVTTRYHPHVFALAEGTPSFGVCVDEYYVQKLVGAGDVFGLGQTNTALLSDVAAGKVPGLVNALAESQVPALADGVISQITRPLTSFVRAAF